MEAIFYLIFQYHAIAASAEAAYLRIGESTFGQPVPDRMTQTDLSLADGARAWLVSLSDTATYNLAVAPPFEVAIRRRNQRMPAYRFTLNDDSTGLQGIGRSWNESLARAVAALPSLQLGADR